MQLAPLRDEAGRVIYLILSANDITERKQAEDALRQERAMLDSVMRATDVMLVLLDSGFHFVWVNAAYAETCRMQPQEMVGKNHFDLYPNADNEAIFRRVRDTGEAIFYKDKQFVFPDQPERGLTFWDWSLTPVKDSGGNVTGLVFSLRETTRFKRAEDALRASEARFRTLFETMTEGFAIYEIVCDASGNPCDLRHLEVNPAFERHTGLRAADILGRTALELFPDAEPIWVGRYRRVALTGEPVHLLAQFGPLRRWFEVSVYRTEPGRLATVLFDVSDRKRAEQELGESRARLAEFAAATFEGIVFSEAGRILDCNPQLEDMLGYPSGSLRGRLIEELVAPEDHLRVIEGIRLQRESHLEHALLRRDGSRIFVEVRGRADAARGPGRRFTVIRDITQRRLAEQALRESEERFRLALRNAPVSVAIQDRELRYVWAYNQRTASQEQIVGHRDAEIFTRDEAAHFDAVKQRVLDEGVEINEQMWLDRPGGRIFLDLYWEPVRDAEGRVTGVGSATVDLTRLKLAEDALRGADRRKDEFLATLAHELRNPLAPICSAVEVLKLQGPTDPTLVAARDMIDRQLQHMVRLVDDLLDVGRITRGKLELRCERLELGDVLRSALEVVASPVRAFGTGCHALPSEADRPAGGRSGPAGPSASEPPRQRVQVHPAGGAHSGHWRRKRMTAGWRCGWRTRARAFPPSTCPTSSRCFSSQRRIRRESARRGGLGIGLSLARSLVQLHGGDIEARSEGPGRGAAFIVRLPTLAAPAAPAPAPDRMPGPKAPSGARRVLVADDNYDNAESLALLLRMGGHCVEVARDGLEALAVAERFRPDVVLLDIGMPELDGRGCCRRLRGQPWGRDMLIVALTGWGRDEDRQRSSEAGFDLHLVKPVDVAALRDLLAENRCLSPEDPRRRGGGAPPSAV